MRTQVIPAQITTVEDKIAGSLNLTQITLLICPAFWATIVYALFIPRFQLSLYKLPLIILVLFLCLALSVRIKGRVVINWLVTIFRYNLRPKYYVFNKNDSFLRTLDLPDFEKKQRNLTRKTVIKEKTKTASIVSISDLVKFEGFFANPKYSLSFKSAKKGGLDVAFKQEQK